MTDDSLPVAAHDLISPYGWPDERFTPDVIAGLVGQQWKVTGPTHDWTSIRGAVTVLAASLEPTALRLRVECDDRTWQALADGRTDDPMPVSVGFGMLPDRTVRVYDLTPLRAPVPSA